MLKRLSLAGFAALLATSMSLAIALTATPANANQDQWRPAHRELTHRTTRRHHHKVHANNGLHRGWTDPHKRKPRREPWRDRR